MSNERQAAEAMRRTAAQLVLDKKGMLGTVNLAEAIMSLSLPSHGDAQPIPETSINYLSYIELSIAVRTALGLKPNDKGVDLTGEALVRAVTAKAIEWRDEIAALKAIRENAFKPGRLDLTESQMTQWVFEDCATVSRPAFPGLYHFIDEIVAMNDGRLVGIQFWGPPPAAIRAASKTEGA